MKKIKYILLFMSFFSLLGLSKPQEKTSSLEQEVKHLRAKAPNISSNVLRLSLIAYHKAREEGLDQKQILTVIDYSKPSAERRLWVFDMKRDSVLYNTWVSHGKNSGYATSTSFSNRVSSLKSSLGVFVTKQTYVGKVGYAVRLDGLEPGVNDNAYRRATVIHGASYVNGEMARRLGRVGRSWGCPAVSSSLSRPLINTIKNDTLVFAYYPDRKWLSSSRYLA